MSYSSRADLGHDARRRRRGGRGRRARARGASKSAGTASRVARRRARAPRARRRSSARARARVASSCELVRAPRERRDAVALAARAGARARRRCPSSRRRRSRRRAASARAARRSGRRRGRGASCGAAVSGSDRAEPNPERSRALCASARAAGRVHAASATLASKDRGVTARSAPVLDSAPCSSLVAPRPRAAASKDAAARSRVAGRARARARGGALPSSGNELGAARDRARAARRAQGRGGSSDLVRAAAIEFADGKHDGGARRSSTRAAKLDPRIAGRRLPARPDRARGGRLRRRAAAPRARRTSVAPDDLPTRLALGRRRGRARRHEAGAEELYRSVDRRRARERAAAGTSTAVFRLASLLAHEPTARPKPSRSIAIWRELEKRERPGAGHRCRRCAWASSGACGRRSRRARTVAKPRRRSAFRARSRDAARARRERATLQAPRRRRRPACRPPRVRRAGGVRVALRREGGCEVATVVEAPVRSRVRVRRRQRRRPRLALVLAATGRARLALHDCERSALERGRRPSCPLCRRAPRTSSPSTTTTRATSTSLLVGDFGARLWRNDGAAHAATSDGTVRRRDATSRTLPHGPRVRLVRHRGLRRRQRRRLPARRAESGVVPRRQPARRASSRTRRAVLARSTRRADAADRRRPRRRRAAGPVDRRKRRSPASRSRASGARDARTALRDAAARSSRSTSTSTARSTSSGSTAGTALRTALLAAGLPQETRARARVGIRRATPLAAADFDGDRRDRPGARAAPSGARASSTRAGTANRGARLALRRRCATTAARVGAIVEVRAGAIYRRIYWRGEPELVGRRRRATTHRRPAHHVAERRRADEPRPRARAARRRRRSDAAFSAVDGQVGSCPFLYTWNGERRSTFVSDVLGITPLGLPMAPGDVRAARPRRVRARDAASSSRRGTACYELQFTEELREVTYLDRVRLDVVDHPAGTEVYPERALLLPALPRAAHAHACADAARAARARRAATARTGREALARDRRRLRGAVRARARRSSPGSRKPWFVELAFDPARVAQREEAAPACMTGWFYWSDASVNMAARARPGVRVRAADPRRCPTARAAGSDAGPPVGFPAGKTKTMVVDVAPILDRDDPRLRVFDDAAPLLGRDPRSRSTPTTRRSRCTTLEPSRREALAARLQRAARDARRTSRPPNGPSASTGTRSAHEPRWNQHPGLYTRYGDVPRLVDAVDDRFVILGAGDALTLRFDARGVPPLPQRAAARLPPVPRRLGQGPRPEHDRGARRRAAAVPRHERLPLPRRRALPRRRRRTARGAASGTRARRRVDRAARPRREVERLAGPDA